MEVEEVKAKKRTVPSDVWKWIAGFLMTIVFAMAGYIWQVESKIVSAVRDEITTSLSPLETRLSYLEEREREDREKLIEDDKRIDVVETDIATINTTTKNIERQLNRIISRLDSLQ